jgi:hypothetical protein
MTSEEVLLKRFKGLSGIQRKELLDFAEFLAYKAKMKNAVNNGLIDEDLSLLDENELKHLEMEFENYEQIYPRR